MEFSPNEIKSRLERCRRMSRRAVTREEREDWRCQLGLDDGQTPRRLVAGDTARSEPKSNVAVGWR